MALRFQRSIKILPGVRLNLSKSGVGVSAGVRGLRVGRDARGRSYFNAGVPGTGLSTRKYFAAAQSPSVSAVPSRPRSGITPLALFVGLVIGGAAVFLVIAFAISLLR